MKGSLPDGDRVLLDSAIETLLQGEALLNELDGESYARKVSIAFNASIGAHYRHCLDHFRNLLDSAQAGELNYDHRERGTPVENDRLAAVIATRSLREGFERLDPAALSRPLEITCKTSYAADGAQVSRSTVGREIMYSVAHAVHHYALIAIMGGMMGTNLPPGFGVAPSTLRQRAPTSATAVIQ
jgi:hypothetical protein